MTESEWLASTDPTAMLVVLQGKASDRKLWLFACAFCRRIWPGRTRGRCSPMWHPLDVAERLADGEATSGQLAAAAVKADTWASGSAADGWQAQIRAVGASLLNPAVAAAVAAESRAVPAALLVLDHLTRRGCKLDTASAASAGREAADAADDAYLGAWATESQAQADLLRDLLGNPFRPSPPLPPAVLAWHDGIVVRLAQAIYDVRDMPAGTLDAGRLGVLADALLDAGCEDEELVRHLRQPRPHVRGCWAVDAILGRG
jgi:hypothetical protein